MLSATALILVLSGAVNAQTLEGLMTPPPDSAEAERVRIWAAAERGNSCRMVVEVLNDSDQVVRRLVDFLAPPGYYNFYWDKRDDSGRRVPEGYYRGRVNYCGDISWEELAAQYSKWELQSDLAPYDTAQPFRLGLIVTGDSALVSAEILNRRDRQFDTMATDTVLQAGTHWLIYDPPDRMPPGNYTILLKVGDYVYRREVSYLP